MKELSIEEKAKRYDEAIEKFDVILNLDVVKESGTIFADDVRKILPELAESEDEKVRKALIKLVKKTGEGYENVIDGVSIENAISWLEKQGEHAKFRDSIQVGDKVTRNQDGVLVNLSQLKRVAKTSDDIDTEKQGEQKPAWSEEDEKMFEHIIAKATLHFSSINYLDEEEINFLKSLKGRIQPQPKQKLSKEDEDTLDFLIDYLGNEIKNTSPYGIIGGLDKAVVLLKAIKEGGVTLHLQAVYDKPVIERSEEDKAIIDYLLQLINNSHKEPCTKGLIAFGAEAWLKSLKDRVQPQPKQEWSGGDEAHLHSLITHLEQWIERHPNTTGADIQGENIAWLKSLRPQNTWKPSDE